MTFGDIVAKGDRVMFRFCPLDKLSEWTLSKDWFYFYSMGDAACVGYREGGLDYIGLISAPLHSELKITLMGDACECGAEKVGSELHSTWCQKNKETL